MLRVLWDVGPSTVRSIHESLPKATGYTTTLKILQKMADKGLVTRDESQKSHVYSVLPWTRNRHSANWCDICFRSPSMVLRRSSPCRRYRKNGQRPMS